MFGGQKTIECGEVVLGSDEISAIVTDGKPLLDTNRFRAARKASVVRSLTSSRCTALVVKHTNTAMYDFTSTGLRVCPHFRVKGPA